MPAAVVRGILISIGIIAALGLAVYENPEVQQWLEEQRHKLATLLRNIGDELDPQSRREAEAFAYGGENRAASSVDNEETARDEAVTTARSPNAGTIRRIPVQGTIDPQEREERQRLGRAYLAMRNQQMLEMQERRRQSRSPSALPTNEDTIKVEEPETPLETAMKSELFKKEEPSHDTETTDDPITPPAVPPKIKLEHVDPTPEPESIASSSQQPSRALVDEHRFPVPGSMPGNELSYEDQLALALAISKEDSTTERMTASYANDIRLATEASLNDTSRAEQPLRSHVSDVSEEDLYSVTPNLTRASLATLNAQHPTLIPSTAAYEHVPEAASFHSAIEARPLVEESAGTKTPTEASSFVFESDVENHAAQSRTLSDASAEMLEVEDQASDVISEDGIATPDSWTEVGDSDTEMPVAQATT